jgi:hypothetical protein
MYRMYDLKLERGGRPRSRSWTIMHRITPDSPLYHHTPESLATNEVSSRSH